MLNYNLDAIDRRIIAELQNDARLTNVDLAQRVGLSPSPCLRRVKHSEDDGYIEAYCATLRRLNRDVRANLKGPQQGRRN
jgi:Lrp/AsnC family leucine-responsive transcriptional regulator